MSSLDFRDYLAKELKNRQTKNKYYSLRSFARDLKSPPGEISKLIRKQVVLTEKKFDRISKAFILSSEQLESYRRGTKINKKNIEQKSIKALNQNYLDLIADWQNIAVLECLHMFSNADVKLIAKNLGLTRKTVKKCLTNLVDAKLITIMNEQVIFNSPQNRSTIPIGKIHASMSKRQIQILKKSILSIKNDSSSRRDHASITLCIDPELVPFASEKLKKFRRELATWLEAESKKKTMIYEISTALFPISKCSID